MKIVIGVIFAILIIGGIACFVAYIHQPASSTAPVAVFGAASSSNPIAAAKPKAPAPTPSVPPSLPPFPPPPAPFPAVSSTTPIVLYSVTPVSGYIGSTITIVGAGFTGDNTVLLDGMIAAAHVAIASSSPDGSASLIITLPHVLSPDCKPGQACPALLRLVNRGAYNLTVENASGTSTIITYAALD